jgi:hypothetical protein
MNHHLKYKKGLLLEWTKRVRETKYLLIFENSTNFPNLNIEDIKQKYQGNQI